MLAQPKPSQEGNDRIRDAIDSGKPFIASKIGAVERTIISDKLRFNSYTDSTKFFASNNAGVSPGDDSTLDFFFEVYTSALQNIGLGRTERKH